MPTTAGKRFASDLRRIRERQNISINDVRDETKIPGSLIEAFEETALLDHAMFNKVYLRSFVRTYAAAIHISPEKASAGLQEAVDGTYEGALVREYLPEEAAAAAEEEEAGRDEAVAEESSAEQEEVDEETEAAAAEAPPEEPEYAEEEPRREAPVAEGAAAAPAWAAQSGSAPDDRGPAQRSHRRESRSDNSAKWIGGLAAVAVVVVLIWIFADPGGGSGESDVAAAGADTAAQATEEPQMPDFEPITLDETMVFRVTATSEDGVQDLKVTRDDEVRRPYWIETGQSDTFHAVNQIIFEQQLDEIALELQGYPFPTDQRDAQNRIVVTRQRAQNYLDSLAMARAGGR